MDEKGYAFTPLALLLMVPVIIFAVAYGDIVNEINAISALAIGGDVTSSIGVTIIKSIQDNTEDDGRNAAFTATSTVISSFKFVTGNNPWLTDSKGFVAANTVQLLNYNLTNTCRVLENQTGRNISLNGVPIDPNANTSSNIFQSTNPAASGYVYVSQYDPFTFNVIVSSIPVAVSQNNQSSSFNTPVQNVTVSIEGLEDPYIWIKTKARNTSIIYQYPKYNPNNNDYHFHDSIDSSGNLTYLLQGLQGYNTTIWGPRPYYVVNQNGLSFFERLEGGKSSSTSNLTRMSTFILWDPIIEEHPNQPISCVDTEYFSNINGTPIQTTKAGVTRTIVCPGSGKIFYLSSTSKTTFNLTGSFSAP